MANQALELHRPPLLSAVIRRLLHLVHHPVAQRSAWLTVAQSARLVMQFIAFILLARHLGAEAFGAFSAVLAAATLLSPLVDLGGYTLISQDVAAGIPAGWALGNALRVSVMMLPAALAALIALKVLLLGSVEALPVIAVGVGRLTGGVVFILVTAVFVNHGMPVSTVVLEVIAGVCLLGATVWLQAAGGSLPEWSLAFFVQNAVVTIAALGLVRHRFGAIGGAWREARRRMRPGALLAPGIAAQEAHANGDKAILPRVADLYAAGLYSVAFRLVSPALFILQAAVTGLLPELFRAGVAGRHRARAVVRKALPLLGALGLLLGAAVWTAIPYVLQLLGGDYAGLVAPTRLLTAVLLLGALNLPLGYALLGTGRYRDWTLGQISAACVNVVLNVLLVPVFGWRAAVGVAVISAGWLTLWYMLRVLKDTTGAAERFAVAGRASGEGSR